MLGRVERFDAFPGSVVIRDLMVDVPIEIANTNVEGVVAFLGAAKRPSRQIIRVVKQIKSRQLKQIPYFSDLFLCLPSVQTFLEHRTEADKNWGGFALNRQDGLVASAITSLVGRTQERRTNFELLLDRHRATKMTKASVRKIAVVVGNGNCLGGSWRIDNGLGSLKTNCLLSRVSRLPLERKKPEPPYAAILLYASNPCRSELSQNEAVVYYFKGNVGDPSQEREVAISFPNHD